MAGSARSTAWHAVDLCYLSAARRILVHLTRAGWRRLALYPALLSMGAGLLSSCTGEPFQPEPRTAALHLPPLETPASPQPVRRPAHKPNPPPATESAPEAMPGQSFAMAEPKPSETAPDRGSPSRPPDTETGQDASGTKLIGLDQPAAIRMFGAAAERSEEPPATVWRYKNANCELDLYFYLDLRSGRMRTLHYAVRGDGGDRARRQDCLRSLIAARDN